VLRVKRVKHEPIIEKSLSLFTKGMIQAFKKFSKNIYKGEDAKASKKD